MEIFFKFMETQHLIIHKVGPNGQLFINCDSIQVQPSLLLHSSKHEEDFNKHERTHGPERVFRITLAWAISLLHTKQNPHLDSYSRH